eukprot:14386639-Alexandrium_andersonii.AAC.1
MQLSCCSVGGEPSEDALETVGSSVKQCGCDQLKGMISGGVQTLTRRANYYLFWRPRTAGPALQAALNNSLNGSVIGRPERL